MSLATQFDGSFFGTHSLSSLLFLLLATLSLFPRNKIISLLSDSCFVIKKKLKEKSNNAIYKRNKTIKSLFS